MNWEPLAARLRAAQRVTVMTGAGISAESGVPTFRGPEGLWRGFDPMRLATPEAFAADPKMVWEWYDWRRAKIAACQPNPAHFALVEIERRVAHFTLITQNVDRLHLQAGTRPENLVEFHGSLWALQCTRCGRQREDRTVPLALPPLCPACGTMERPGVVWFGEAIPGEAIRRATEALDCDVMLVIGTSGVVEPAASLSAAAQARRAFIAEINLEPTPVSARFDFTAYGKAGELVPQLLEATGERRESTT